MNLDTLHQWAVVAMLLIPVALILATWARHRCAAVIEACAIFTRRRERRLR